MFTSLVLSSKPIAINSHLFTDNPQVCIYNSNLSPGSQSFIFNCLPDFIFLDSKITEDGDCSHKIKIRLLLGRKAMTNLDSVLKSRDITLLTKFYIVKAMVFPVVVSGCESWTIKLSTKELMLLNFGVGEDSSESLELQGDPTSPS